MLQPASTVATAELIARLKNVIGQRGLLRVSREIGLSRQALLQLTSGLNSRRGTLLLAETNLTRIETAMGGASVEAGD
jgi:hypothetical protein